MKLKKQLGIILITGVLSMMVVGCSSTTEEKSATGNDGTKNEQIKESPKNAGVVYNVEGAISDESGIIQTIKEVKVFDNMKDAVESYNQNEVVVTEDNKDKVTVVVKFEIKNNNEFKISTYPTQGKIITNTGEQKEADLMASESFDGDVFEGVTNEGHVLFNLDKTKVDELSDFKIVWDTSHENGTPENYDDDYFKENKLEVKLK